MSCAASGAGIVITGCGTINALGPDVASFWRALVRGECGIRPLAAPFEAASGLIAASIPGPLPNDRPGEARHSRTDRLALVAAEEALREARLLDADVDPRRVAIVVGTTTGGIREVEEALVAAGSFECVRTSALRPYESATVADALAARFGAAGPRHTVHSACASGASAILLGALLVQSGQADIALAGGADSLARVTLAGFQALRALDRAPCRPFDRNRRGLSIGEGAGLVVVEQARTARARRAPMLARLLGAAQLTDAHHLTAPAEDGAGAARALGLALAQAGITADHVDHVNAHGTGTPANDSAEARALRSVLGSKARACPVVSIKGAVGHTLGASGAIEAIASIRTLQSGTIPPTVGSREPDETLGLDVVREAPRMGDWRVVVSNSFGFGGANAVLVLGRSSG